MSDSLRFRFATALIGLISLGLTACGSSAGSRGVSTLLSPYKIDKVQGNVVTREQLQAVKVGMPKNMVKDILGTPLLSSVFHGDRWDYVFTLQRQGVEPQMRRVAVFFKGDALAKVEADELPSEAEFVASLKSVAKLENLPPLVASDESLKAYPAAKPAAFEAPLPPVSANYPPLESPRR